MRANASGSCARSLGANGRRSDVEGVRENGLLTICRQTGP